MDFDLEKHGSSAYALPRLHRLKGLLQRPRSRRSRLMVIFVVMVLLLGFWNAVKLGTWRRDLAYVLRPVWDTAPKGFTVIPHFAAPRDHWDITDGTAGTAGSDVQSQTNGAGAIDIPKWCSLHGWTTRTTRPLLVDAVLVSSELDMLETRLREYLPHVDIFVIVESDRTFAGTPKPLHFSDNLQHFDTLVNQYRKEGSEYPKIVYGKVDHLLPDQKKGSFANEYKMRQSVSGLLDALKLQPGSLVLNSDVDEIISRQTLQLLKACETPDNIHLNVKNYRYAWQWPIPDDGYWRPHLTTVGESRTVAYGHGRVSDVMLDSAGWHCTLCFKTLKEMREKMVGYSHNDRVRDMRVAEIGRIREQVCEGREIFEMWPVSVFPRF